jgi:hypothetical protein
MADPSYILFNKTLEQARRLGGRGGRAYACNQRARRARMPPPPSHAPTPAATQGNHRRSHRGTGRAISLATWSGKADLRKPAFLPDDGGARWEAETGVRSEGGTRSICHPQEALKASGDMQYAAPHRARRSEIGDRQAPSLLTGGLKVLKAPDGNTVCGLPAEFVARRFAIVKHLRC